jgi:hypothetical protein
MSKFLGLVGVALTVSLALVASAAAQGDFRCNGTFTGRSYDDVIVPRGGSCTLIDSTVADDVKVRKNAYFQANDTAIGGDVYGERAQTVFIDTDSRVSGRVDTYKTIQVFILNSTVIRGIEVERTSEVVQICGTTVLKGDIEVERSGTDILIGDPLAVDCAGNSVMRGDVEVERSFTDVEFVIRGNSIRKGDLKVFKNTGPVPKFVTGNTGGDDLKCRENSSPFLAGPTLPGEQPNQGWDSKRGQCR